MPRRYPRRGSRATCEWMLAGEAVKCLTVELPHGGALRAHYVPPNQAQIVKYAGA